MYFKKTWIAGDTIDTHLGYTKRYGKYYIRNNKYARTTPAMQKYNQKMQVRKLTRIINANFKPDDIHLVLKYYRGQRPDPNTSKKYIAKFIRKLRAYYRKQGNELKYIATTAFGEKGAIHHHLIINAIDDGRYIRNIWPYGHPYTTYLYDDPDCGNDYSRLAAYIVYQCKEGLKDEDIISDSLSWSQSKNLILPQDERKQVKHKRWREPPKPLPGYRIVFDSIDASTSPVTGMVYLFYRQVRIPPRQRLKLPNGKILKDAAAVEWLYKQNISDMKTQWDIYCDGVIKKIKGKSDKHDKKH